eukprot:TRINITY_DN2762_c0_g1_i5.p1 TRINITY_DN2762_c0_g1~~TRINITY_DN2762_c0_g1_i5.p1  ORF type:complete len:348 (-),score=88.82 TRINITY_DN2762_c0_g1_i5:52-1095(-)
MREEVVKEFVATERDYVRDLDIIVRVWMQPMKKLGILTQQQMNEIFSTIEMILQINKEVLVSIEKGADSDTLGKELVAICRIFKSYGPYCANQPAMMAAVSKFKQDPQISSFLDTTKENPVCRGLDLLSFLIKPVQRLCKYPLLLRELIRHTPPSHPDYDQIEKAHALMNDLAMEVNEQVRLLKMNERVLEIEVCLEGWAGPQLFQPWRRLIIEGSFKVFSSQEQNRVTERVLMVFTDMLLFTKKKGKMYKYKQDWELHATMIRDLPDTPDISNGIEMALLSKQYRCVLLCVSPEEKKRWMTTLESLVSEQLQQEMTRIAHTRRDNLTQQPGGSERSGKALLSGLFQ